MISFQVITYDPGVSGIQLVSVQGCIQSQALQRADISDSWVGNEKKEKQIVIWVNNRAKNQSTGGLGIDGGWGLTLVPMLSGPRLATSPLRAGSQ
jgi:hypothetical protein